MSIAQLPKTESSPGNQAVPSEQKPGQRESWIAEFSKYAVIGVFALYVFGFIIWYAHLAKYGLGPPSFWKIEFLSASLCYFAIVFSIAFPAAILFSRINMPFDRSINFMQSSNVSLYPLLILSAFLVTQVRRLFFPTRILDQTIPWWAWLAICLFALQIAISILLRVRKITGRIPNIVKSNLWFALYIVLWSIYGLWHSDRVDRMFLLATSCLYLSATFVSGLMIEEHWKSFSPHLKVLSFACATFLLVQNAQLFGSSQFERIPQGVGGGEPLRALLVFTPEQEGVAAVLSIPRADTSPQRVTPLGNVGTNGVFGGEPRTHDTNSLGATAVSKFAVPTRSFYGPVSILMKSDRDIIFIVPTTNAGSHLRPRAKMLSSDRVLAMEFLNGHE